MPLVPAKCTQCGAALTLDPSQDAAVCPFCGTPFVVEKAINNYNVTNHTTIGTVEHVEHLHVEDSHSIEARLKNAETHMGPLSDGRRAFEIFKSVADDKGDEWRAWWGMARAKSRDFRNTTNLHEPQLGEVLQYAGRAIRFAPDAEKPRLRQIRDAFSQELDKQADAARKKVLGGEDWQRIEGLSGRKLIERYEALLSEQRNLSGEKEARKKGTWLETKTDRRGNTQQKSGCAAMLGKGVLVFAACMLLYTAVGYAHIGNRGMSYALFAGGALAAAALVAWVVADKMRKRRRIDEIDARLAEIGRELSQVKHDLIAKRRWVREYCTKWQDPITVAPDKLLDNNAILYYENMPQE